MLPLCIFYALLLCKSNKQHFSVGIEYNFKWFKTIKNMSYTTVSVPCKIPVERLLVLLIQEGVGTNKVQNLFKYE